MDQTFAGAANPFALLGMQTPGSVAGLDFVGAARPLHLQPMHAAHAAVKSQKREHLADLAMANYVPQVRLGCSDTTTKVKAAATGIFSPEGSVPLRITMWHVAPSIAPYFAINSIFVARINLMAGSQPVPAEDFISNARNAPLEFPIAAAGSQVSVSATNIDTADHYFMSSFAAIDLTTSASRMVL